jgi:succinylglutamate desuccinylase
MLITSRYMCKIFRALQMQDTAVVIEMFILKQWSNHHLEKFNQVYAFRTLIKQLYSFAMEPHAVYRNQRTIRRRNKRIRLTFDPLSFWNLSYLAWRRDNKFPHYLAQYLSCGNNDLINHPSK